MHDEFVLVATVVYLTIGPQFLAYLLSGLSGSAATPIFVRQISTIAVWSIIKFLAGLSGILLAHPFARLLLRKQVFSSDFYQGMIIISAVFVSAVMYHIYSESQLRKLNLSSFQVFVSLSALRCFTKSINSSRDIHGNLKY